jgi:hypothetical protein
MLGMWAKKGAARKLRGPAQLHLFTKGDEGYLSRSLQGIEEWNNWRAAGTVMATPITAIEINTGSFDGVSVCGCICSLS